MEADKELKKFKTNKERMIMYLSLLLKHNWEKEKYDFRGNIYKKILVFTAVLSAIYVTYNHFVVLKINLMPSMQRGYYWLWDCLLE